MTVEVDLTAVESLTSALVDSNDRLLGLLALITGDVPSTLASPEMIDAVLDRARAILHLDFVRVQGSANHVWGNAAAEDGVGVWSSAQELGDYGDLAITFCRETERFGTADTKLLSAVARLVANAVATSVLHEQQLHQELINNEHATAARITTMALPDAEAAPELEGASVFSNLVPARTTGGDLYTWSVVDGDLWFALGDVSGKGLPAAVMMSSIVGAVEAAMQRYANDGLTAVHADVDSMMHRRLSDAAMFSTLAIGRWTSTNRRLTIANAGHSPVVFARRGDAVRVEASIPPMGVIEGCEPTLWTTKTEPGDLLVLATDGFTEQTNSEGDMYGEDRFDSDIAALPLGTAEEAGQQLLDSVAAFEQGVEQADDRALVVVRFQ